MSDFRKLTNKNPIIKDKDIRFCKKLEVSGIRTGQRKRRATGPVGPCRGGKMTVNNTMGLSSSNTQVL